MNTAFGVNAIIGLLLTSLVITPAGSAEVFNESLNTETLTISVSGDLLVHHSQYEQALADGGGSYDFRNQLAPAKSLLTADINICHLETPLTPGEPSTFPIFATPDSLATAIKATGWDGCSAASNHSLDRGEAGIYHTIKTMRAAGLKVAGIRNREPKNRRTDSAIGWYQPKPDLMVAHLAYTWSTNGIRPKYNWLVNSPINPKSIIKDAQAAKRNGADLVIVSIHAGNEYSPTPSSYQKFIARTIMANPAVDAMVGHHAHVVQDAELISGKPVVYGLGNFWSGQGAWSDQPASQSGALVTLKFTRSINSDTSFSYVGARINSVLTTPENWQVFPANRIPVASRWGSAARAAIAEISARLSPLQP
jgi:hypothetical protein